MRIPGRRWGLLVCAILAGTSLDAQAVTDPPVGTDDERGRLNLAVGNEMRVSLGGYLQVDGRWLSGARSTQQDGSLLRRARLVFDASSPNGWHIRLQPDFGQGRVLIQDAYVGRSTNLMTMRVGRFRPAYGVERMQSSSTLLHPERGLVNSLMPSRSFGAQVHMTRGAWRVAAGGFRTPIGSDASPVDTDGDIDAVAGEGHDLLLRISHLRDSGNRYTEWQAGVLAGAERGTADAPALSRVLSVAQQPILTYRVAASNVGPAFANGARTRLTAGGVVGNRQMVFMGEGALLRQRVQRDELVVTPSLAVISARLARVWNGTRRATQEITPLSPRGAVEVGVRGGAFSAWGSNLGSVVTRLSATHAQMAGMAASWLPTALTRITLAYDVTARANGQSATEHALSARWQQAF